MGQLGILLLELLLVFFESSCKQIGQAHDVGLEVVEFLALELLDSVFAFDEAHQARYLHLLSQFVESLQDVFNLEIKQLSLLIAAQIEPDDPAEGRKGDGLGHHVQTLLVDVQFLHDVWLVVETLREGLQLLEFIDSQRNLLFELVLVVLAVLDHIDWELWGDK